MIIWTQGPNFCIVHAGVGEIQHVLICSLIYNDALAFGFVIHIANSLRIIRILECASEGFGLACAFRFRNHVGCLDDEGSQEDSNQKLRIGKVGKKYIGHG